MRHLVDDIVAPLKPNQNAISVHPHKIFIVAETDIETALQQQPLYGPIDVLAFTQDTCLLPPLQ